MKFEVGDTVRLKSGGPLMTVEVINAGNIRCVWFKKGDVERGVFNHALLESDSILPDLTVDEERDS
ncbi:DUF2158 domain-containing protein [Brucella pituitosa]|uniref:YodC family protein n=1 Tax=Brucella pituitosa TaxID=571256 RepID=UPI0020069967|nr:DUF2158 domain-containing protein [Brucella pituitosa]MCK4204258.1 DUF2158 domain-containing protein [Brucella pituitosa]